MSLILGLIKYASISSAYKNTSCQLKFVEIWNDFINFLIGGLIGYYFISVRWPQLVNGMSPNTGDFVFIIIFLVSMFGHLPVISHHLTEGISTIVEKVLKK